MITVATTTIKVEHSDQAIDDIQDPWGEGYDTPSDIPDVWNVVAEGVRAVIDAPTGTEGGPGDTEVINFTLKCDPVILTFRDRVTDETSGQMYSVVWAVAQAGIFGLSHVTAGLRTIKGMQTTQGMEGS